MDPPEPWYRRVWAGFLRFWRTENPKWAIVRDIAVAGFIVLVLLGALWAYTGQSFPSQMPLVVVESGSMMHGPHTPCGGGGCTAYGDPPFGRIGSIDPGDLVLVKKIDVLDDVEPAFGTGKRDGYGGHGDVIVYKPGGSSGRSPVIHRVMLMIYAVPEGCTPNAGASPCTYRIPDTCDAEFGSFVVSGDWQKYCAGSKDPISLNLRREGLFLELSSYPCATQQQGCGAFYSGVITKGDNNDRMDQTSPYQGTQFAGGSISCCPVQLDWIIGKTRAEIPWFGLIKLMLYGNKNYGCGKGQACSDPTRGSQWTIIRATAPWDIWISLFLATAVLLVLPVAIDMGTGRVRRYLEKRRERRGKPPSQ